MSILCPACQGNLEITNSIDHDIGGGYYLKEDYECSKCRSLYYHAVKVDPQGRWEQWFRLGKDHRTTPVEMPLPRAA